MTFKELVKEVPYMISVAYAQGKAIIVYDNGSCKHVKMPERVARRLMLKLDEDYKLRTTYRTEKEEKEKKRRPKSYDEKLMIELYLSGYTHEYISLKIGLSIGTVGYKIRRLISDGKINLTK